MTYIPVKHQEKNYRIPTTSTPNNRAQLIYATSVSLLNLNRPTNLPPVSK